MPLNPTQCFIISNSSRYTNKSDTQICQNGATGTDRIASPLSAIWSSYWPNSSISRKSFQSYTPPPPSLWRDSPGPPHCRGFTITDTPHSVGLLWTTDQPDAETSDNTQSFNRQTAMPPVGFEPAIPTSEQQKTHVLRQRGHWEWHSGTPVF